MDDDKHVVLIVGSGGREHALAWKLSKSSFVEHLYVCPGNGGTAGLERTTNVDVPLENDFKSLLSFAIEKKVSLLVPGPEQPLVDGIETVFRKAGIPVFGPSARAARMEGSKAFSKAFMARHGIPTATYKVFTDSQFEEAVSFVKTCGFKVVLKADGLAAGKGVLIPENEEEAIQGLREILVEKKFGGAGNEVVIEEYLTGPELSILAFSDGYTIVPLPAAQDHKRIGEGDTGPNTGGMGAYAPAPVATPQVMQRIMKETLQPTIDGMRREGFPFVGLLFTGFMLTEAGPKVLEYNVRFGDPETEAIMLLLENCDLGEIMLACVERRLDSVKINISNGFAVSVVLASHGYPGSYTKGKVITFGDVPLDVQVFHAGTSVKGDSVVTSGGRVLVVSASGSSVQEAVDKAYAAVGKIEFDGVTYRRDIAHRALRDDTGTSKVSLTYAQAGVSVDAGNEFVNQIKSIVKSTKRPGADGAIGGFGAVFDLKSLNYQDPLLVSGTDGVGTKLHVAIAAGLHDTVGIDLVAMSVNDLLVQGAEPLFFLDYYACSQLRVDVAVKVVKGIAEGCLQAGCTLVGGETAEMPGMYNGDDYDLAGFAVGVVERNALLPRADISPGDVLLGLPSSGIHSNGFSLVRKIVDLTGLQYSSPCPWSSDITLGAALLEPTRIYVRSLLPTIRTGHVKGLSHITGGGFLENVPRVFPPGLGCYVDVSTWTLPPVFQFLMKHGNVQPKEMCRTFNNGVGMVLIVSREHVDEVKQSLIANGEQVVYEIGQVIPGQGVELRGIESWLTY